VACLALAGDLLAGIQCKVDPDGIEKTIDGYRKALKLQANEPVPGVKEVMGGYAFFGAYAVIMLTAAIQMLRMRMYPLAVASCFLPCLHLANGCCCLGLPIGIWAFVILMRPDVRDAFYAP
jgi:hypothetical protein